MLKNFISKKLRVYGKLTSFVVWFVCICLSYVFESNNWLDKGFAFLVCQMAITSSFLIIFAIFHFIGKDSEFNLFDYQFYCTILYTVMIGAGLLASFAFNKIFNVNFFTFYEILALGQCLNFLCLHESK